MSDQEQQEYRATRTEILHSIPAGCFGLAQTRGVVPWIIQHATKSPYDHAFITLGDGVIAEAVPGGVRISRIREYGACKLAFSAGRDTTPAQRADIAAKARSLAGTGYNFAVIAEQIITGIGWQWRWLIRAAADDHDLDCAQLVAVCGIAAGVDSWACGKPADQVTPADLGRLPGVQPA